MPTDLTTHRDHPANVLDTFGGGDPLQISPRQAANVLRDHESTFGLTFAALDNDALARVREAYHIIATSGPGYIKSGAEIDLTDAVRDLLGLDD